VTRGRREARVDEKQVHDEMTVGELMGLLEDEPEDAIVRIVHQEAWPLQEVVGGLASGSELHDDDPDEEDTDAEPDEESVIYLVANGHPQDGSPYGSKSAWNEMRRGWRP
jgi:hypothetical protein